MSSIPKISVKKLDKVTHFAPLVALGFYVRTADLLSPITSRLIFPKRMHTEEPVEAIIDLWISMLAGCRAVSQINTKLRPDLPLAAAWGREQFKEQSTIARVLDGCKQEQVEQLRAGVDALYQWLSQSPHHAWHQSPLMIDIDLTGLPAGRQAEGSVPGYASGKRGRACDNFAESVQQLTAKVFARFSFQGMC